MKIGLAGAGAFGVKHIEALAQIDDVEVVSLIGRKRDATQEVANKFGIPHVATELSEALSRPDLDAVILATPTQLHASQAIAAQRR
jgi:2-hydroxy-4-carboxymuconate semialdehyde hemiacetal dehydrogenase